MNMTTIELVVEITYFLLKKSEHTIVKKIIESATSLTICAPTWASFNSIANLTASQIFEKKCKNNDRSQ